MRFPFVSRKSYDLMVAETVRQGEEIALVGSELARIKGAYGEPCPYCGEVGGDLYIVHTEGYRARIEMRCRCGSKRVLRYRQESENPPQKEPRKVKKTKGRKR